MCPVSFATGGHILRSNVKVITLLIRYYASVCVIWSHNKSVAVAQPEGSGGHAPPEIGFTRKFLAAPLS